MIHLEPWRGRENRLEAKTNDNVSNPKHNSKSPNGPPSPIDKWQRFQPKSLFLIWSSNGYQNWRRRESSTIGKPKYKNEEVTIRPFIVVAATFNHVFETFQTNMLLWKLNFKREITSNMIRIAFIILTSAQLFPSNKSISSSNCKWKYWQIHYYPIYTHTTNSPPMLNSSWHIALQSQLKTLKGKKSHHASTLTLEETYQSNFRLQALKRLQ